MDLNERLAGAVWGHLVGDAVGVPYEFKSAGEISGVEFRGHGTHNQPPGTWSDDGALMLALLDSLLRERGLGAAALDLADQAERFLAWADKKAYTPDGDGLFDIGIATSGALGRLRHGTPPEAAGGHGERDNGNGSLMRILPIALVERDLGTDELVDHAHRASSVTHGHAISQAACALYVLVARNLLAGSARGPALADARATLRTIYSGLPETSVRIGALDAIETWTGRSGRGFVIDAFWSAWDALAGAKTYRDTIERAVRYGNDTDTTACIAGGLAGARFGLHGIPADWVAGMRGKSIVEPLVARLAAMPPAQATHTAGEPASAGTPAGARTSIDNPIHVAWVNLARVPGLAGAPGALGMTFLPGKHDTGSAGRHWRDLELDTAMLRERHAVDVLVVLVEDHELRALAVPNIADVMAAHGIDLVRYPIVDQGVPDPGSLQVLLDTIARSITDGRRVVVACRGGLGRTGTVVACALRTGGLDAKAAIALTRATRHSTIENATQEAFVTAWKPPSSADRDLPFARYECGGRRRLGRPRQGDLTARHGYGPPVFAQCGYTCVYCGLDMAATFEAWLQLSVDHVIPRQMRDHGYPADLLEDITNLVTCCRACNDFGNRYTATDSPPATDEVFFDLRDRVFRERKAMIAVKREQERAIFARLPAVGPDRPAIPGEEA